jgi:hypothetical protein
MTTTLTQLAFDCADAGALASFWAAVLDLEVDDGASPEFALVKGTPSWMFLQVPEPKTAKNRMHADLLTDDLPGEVLRLKELGASHVADHTEAGFTWATLTDPEGNEFDVVAG